MSVTSTHFPSQLRRLLIDTFLVLTFVLLGLLSHHQPPSQLLSTALPFLLALAAAHLGILVVSSRKTLPLLLEGFMTWVTTLVLGIGLRLAFGDTAAPAFVLVAAGTLLVFLVGWRTILYLAYRKAN